MQTLLIRWVLKKGTSVQEAPTTVSQTYTNLAPPNHIENNPRHCAAMLFEFAETSAILRHSVRNNLQKICTKDIVMCMIFNTWIFDSNITNICAGLLFI